MTTTVSWTSDETTTLKETVTVDAPARLVDVRGRLTHIGKDPQRGSYEYVEAGDAVFAPTEGGGWRRVGKDELDRFGRSAPREKTSAMPEVLRSFIPLVDIGQGEVSGTVDVLDFVDAARFGSVFKQFSVTEALSGTVDAYVTVENGTIRKIRLEGRGGDYSAGTDRAAGDLESLLFFTQVEVVVTSVDQAVKIPDPRGGTKTV